MAISPVIIFISTRLLFGSGREVDKATESIRISNGSEELPSSVFASEVLRRVQSPHQLLGSALARVGIDIVDGITISRQIGNILLRAVIAFCIPLAVLPISVPAT